MDFVKDVLNPDIFEQEPKCANALFAYVLRFYVFSWNIFHTFDIDMLKMSFIHEETLICGYTCNVCGKKFKIIWYLRQVLQLREEKEQKEQKDKMEQKDQKKQKEQ